MKNPFAVGDRVRVFDRCYTRDGVVTAVSVRGELMSVRTGKETESDIYHPRQCRRLVKRKPARRWLLLGQPSTCTGNYIHVPVRGPELGMDEVVIVREVRQKK